MNASSTIFNLINEAENLRDTSRKLHHQVVMLSMVGAGGVMLYKWLEQCYLQPQTPAYVSPTFWASIVFFLFVPSSAHFIGQRRSLERGIFYVTTATYLICYWLSFRHALGLYELQQDSILAVAQWSVIPYMAAFGLFRLRPAFVLALSVYLVSVGVWLYFVHIHASYAELSLSMQDFSNFLLLGFQAIVLCVALRSMTHVATKARMMAALAIKDGLTGLANRLYLDHFLQEEVPRRQEKGLYTSVAVCDIDHFKRVNDMYSHTVGDKVLKTFAGILQQHKRSSDIAGRYGGEEFVLIFLDIPAVEAATLCETLRLAIESYDWSTIATDLHITASFGISDGTDIDQHDSIISLVHQADLKMYQAKDHGRNQVRV